jgi:hypothetical protein
MRYLLGFVFVIVGALQIWLTSWLIRNFGYVQWAEDKIGNGGTWTFHKASGVILIMLGFMIGSGQVYDILDWIFGR